MRTQRTIRNCTVRMDTPCPKRWDELQPTDAGNVRHCAVCARDVFFCASTEETLEHARAGHCIAREEPHPSELPRIVLGRPTVVYEVTSEQTRAQEMARRERGINSLLRGRLEGASRTCPDCGYPVLDFRKSCYVCGFACTYGNRLMRAHEMSAKMPLAHADLGGAALGGSSPLVMRPMRDRVDTMYSKPR